jgi:hypothetical protein
MNTPNTSNTHAASAAWNDFNDAPEQSGFDLIPRGTLLKVRMSIKPGGFDDPAQGWTGGWATMSEQTGSVYLNAEFVVLDGLYAKRKLWSLIGLYSPKGDEWTNMGRSFIRALLNSARGIDPKDASPQAQAARRIADFGELEGLEFVGRVDLEKDARGDDKNTLRQAIESGHKDYTALMQGGGAAGNATGNARSTSTTSATTSAAATPANSAGFARPAAAPSTARAPITKPAWAQ